MEEKLIKEYYEKNPEGIPKTINIPEIYEMHQIFEKHIKTEAPDIFLDAGCGKGYMGETVSKCVNQYYGFDISSSAINEARKRIPKGIFKNGSINNLPYKNEMFDCIMCPEVLEHIPNYQNAIKELTRVLKSGSKIFISTPNKINPDMIWRTKFKGKYTLQIYDTPIYYKKLIKEFKKNNLEVLEFFSFFYLPLGGELMPNFIKKPSMVVLKLISKLINKPLGLYLFFSLKKK